MASHVLSTFKVPLSICDKMDAIISKFFWNSTTDRKGIPWVRRQILHLPKGMGGLGIRSFRIFNQALLMTKAWRLKDKPLSLLTRVYNAKYNNALDWTHGIPQPRTGAKSWGWTGLSEGINLLQQGCCWKVGSGTSISVMEDRWVHPGPVICSDTVSYDTMVLLNVSDLMIQNQRRWNSPLIKSLFDRKTRLSILSLELGDSTATDFIYWPSSINGVPSAKTAYAWLMTMSQPPCSSIWRNNILLPQKFWKWLWGWDIMPKWKFFIWRICNGALAVHSTLRKRGIEISSTCHFCNLPGGTLDHLFRTCTVIQRVWMASSLGLLGSTFHPRDILHQAHVSYHLQCQLWHAPQPDNRNIFLLSTATPAPPGFHTVSLGTNNIGTSSFILQFDGAWEALTSRAGAAWGSFVFSSFQGGSASFWASSSIHVEAIACWKGILWAHASGWTTAMLHTDCQQLINLLRTPTTAPISIHWVIRNILHEARKFQWCLVCKVDRQ
ncbi:hypothetical protein RDABS01_002837 [Bienertia sinuspersici]